MSHKITQQDHKNIKRHLLWHTVRQTAYKYGVSPKTVLQVRGSRNFEEYTEHNKAQHPQVQHSLREDILDIHKLLFDKQDNKYIEPLTARVAALQIKVKLMEKRRSNESN